MGSASPQVSGPRLVDSEFFSLLDCSRPELAGVRAKVAQSDWAAARHALAEYMRSRPTPKWDIDPRAIGRQADAATTEADQALTHRFNSLGIEWQFGDAIDWKFNPTTQPDSKWPHNHEWTWQFNRHTAWVALAKAFYDTGNEKYAREFAAELTNWVHECPVPLGKVQNVPFSRWRTIEAGIRTGQTWPEVFPRVLAAKSFDDAALIDMLKSFVDHAEYLMKFRTGGNWLTMEANGLYHVGALFPEFKDAKLWRETAVGRLDHELDIQVYPDGAQTELAPGYHCVTIRNFIGPIELSTTTGFQPPADYLPKMEKMFDYLLFSMDPDRKTPPLNDSSRVNVMSMMTLGAKYFPARDDFRWMESSGGKGRPPSGTSHFFPYAGQSFMRGGWDTQALWLCMDGGPFGSGHQHEDKLGVILAAYGQPLLVEGGTYTYDASQWRQYVLSSRAHNVVLVDGLEQNRGHRDFGNPNVVKTPLPHVWESNDIFDHVAGRYDEGWGRQSIRSLTQTRHVFFLKPDLFIIADVLESQDGRPHNCEALFHLNAPNAVVDGLKVTTQNPGPNLVISAFGAEGARVVKGQKEPVVQGWLPDQSAGYGGIKPIPTAIYNTTVNNKTTVLYALYPSAQPTKCPVTDLQMKDDSLTVRFADAPEKRIHIQPLLR